MRFPRARLTSGRQRGFTLVELLVTVAATGILVAAMPVAFFATIQGTASGNNMVSTMNDVQTAGDWITHDVQMAQSVTPGAFPNFLDLKWQDYNYGSGGNKYEVTYNYSSGVLQRQYSVTTSGGTTTTSTITVSRYISSISATFASGVFTLAVTSSLGATYEAGTATRTFQAVPRSSS